MARLRESATGSEITLLADFLIGRAERCDLIIEDPRVSTSHATLLWEGARWTLRDLGSTNHTFVNGRALAPTEAFNLEVGDVVDFGTAATWEVIDSAPPLPTATAIASGERIVSSETDILAIGEGAILYRGEGGAWHTRDGRKEDTFRDGDNLVVHNIRYRLSLPAIAHRTEPAGGFVGKRAIDLDVTLIVAPGEDRIELNVACHGEQRSLGRNGHNRMLLWLARARVEDQKAELPTAMHGWRDIEELALHTYKDIARINTEVYRIRHRFAPLHLLSFADIIERDERQIRLGTPRIAIVEEK